MNSLDSRSFLKGVGMGMAIGASMGVLMTPKKKGDNVIGRALKAAGELPDNTSEAIKYPPGASPKISGTFFRKNAIFLLHSGGKTL